MSGEEGRTGKKGEQQGRASEDLLIFEYNHHNYPSEKDLVVSMPGLGIGTRF